MPLFSHNKKNDNDGTLNGIPFDGGFGDKNREKYEEFQANNNNDNTSSGLTGRENNGNYPNASDPSYDNNAMSGGGGPQSGGMFNERGTGVGQGYDNQQHPHQHGPGANTGAGIGSGTGGTGGFISQSHSDRLGRDAEVRRQEQGFGSGGGQRNTEEYNAMGFDSPPSSNPNTNYGSGTGNDNRAGIGSGTGGSGGFISQSHSDRLGRDADVRRQEQGFGNSGGRNTEEYNAMGFDSPPSNPSNTNYGSGTGNTGSSNIPHNSLSLKEQAEQKARESESMQKQAVEVGKAEELEKAALAARQRAVEHGAHPLHGQPGGIDARGGQA